VVAIGMKTGGSWVRIFQNSQMKFLNDRF